jgi:hypothetical protein
MKDGAIMRTIVTSSDIGSILIGTKDAYVAVPNGYGDGYTSVFIFEDREEGEKVLAEHDYNFITTCSGTRLEIPEYDCPSEWKPVITLNGRYAIYNNNSRNMLLIRWGDAKEF